MFGDAVGIPLPPGSEVGAVIADLASSAGRDALQRIDALKARLLWTTVLERLYDDVAEFPDDADPELRDAAVHALVAEIARVEREHPE
jgi:hypothetical protein